MLRTMIESLFFVEGRQEKGSQDQGGKSGGQHLAATLHHFLAEVYRRLKYSHPQILQGAAQGYNQETEFTYLINYG